MTNFKYSVLVSTSILLLAGSVLCIYGLNQLVSQPSTASLITLAGLLLIVVSISIFIMLRIHGNLKESARLSEQNSLFSHLIANMPIGITVKEPRNNFCYLSCNNAAATIYGKTAKEIIGHTDFELFPSEIAQALRNHDEKLTITLTAETTSKELYNFGYGGIWLKTTKLPVPDSSGKGYLLLQILENISDSVKLESQLQHSQRMDEIGKLAGGVAHEFNNLLQVILGYCEFIREDNKKDFTFANLEQIEKAATNAMQLTRQLLTYSRRTEMKKEAVELSQVVAGALKMISRIIGVGVEITFKPADNPIIVRADVTQLEQILVNLCVNARDAMSGKGKIAIAIEQVVEVQQAINSGIRENLQQIFGHLRVADSGPGIPAKFRKQLFMPFFTTKEIGKGTGLGLAIIYAIMKQHDGYIFYDESFSAGSAFDIYLPHADISDMQVQTKKTVDENPFDTTDLLILVAEDEPAVRNMNVKLLKKHGFRTLETNNGEEAIQLFSQHADEISALVFDVMMPRITGKAAYEAISKIKPDMPTIFCTGYSGEDLQSEFAGHENVIILNKPFKTGQLIKNLQTIIRKSKQELRKH